MLLFFEFGSVNYLVIILEKLSSVSRMDTNIKIRTASESCFLLDMSYACQKNRQVYLCA